MSLFESGDSNGEVSLAELFGHTASVEGSSHMELERLSFLICRGGWPGALELREEAALDEAVNYVDAVIRSDINRTDGVRKNPDNVRKLMRSLARHQGQPAANTVIAADMATAGKPSLGEETVASYIAALKRIFVVEDMPSWNPNLRSKTAIRSSDVRYYVDPSIAAAAIGAGPENLIADLKTMGFLFETLCVRDLRVYADALGGEVFHYRDKNGLECDAVIHLRNGSYGLTEIKLGGELAVEEGAATLKRMHQKIDTDKMKEPSFLMVLTGIGNYAYRREDGVFVVPVGCLRD